MLNANHFSLVLGTQSGCRFGHLGDLKQRKMEENYAKQHGPGNTTCFAVEPLPTVMDQYDYQLRDHVQPVPTKVWGDYRETDSIAIRLIQLKKIFEQNPYLELCRGNVYFALDWLKKYFPMVRQDIRPSILEDHRDETGQVEKSDNTITLCEWDAKTGFEELNAQPIINMLLIPKGKQEMGGREIFGVDSKLKESLGRSITCGIEEAILNPESPTRGVHVAKSMWHLLPGETRKSFAALIDSEQSKGSYLVLGSNEQKLEMNTVLHQQYKPATALNTKANGNELRQVLNRKESLINPPWIYQKEES